MARVADIHRRKLIHVAELCEQLAGTFNKLASEAAHVLDNGGKLNGQDKLSFVVSAFPRLFKDVGVIEQLQCDGVSARSTLKPRP